MWLRSVWIVCEKAESRPPSTRELPRHYLGLIGARCIAIGETSWLKAQLIDGVLRSSVFLEQILVVLVKFVQHVANMFAVLFLFLEFSLQCFVCRRCRIVVATSRTPTMIEVLSRSMASNGQCHFWSTGNHSNGNVSDSQQRRNRIHFSCSNDRHVAVILSAFICNREETWANKISVDRPLLSYGRRNCTTRW